MKIKTRTYSKYINVDVSVGGGDFDLGFHNSEQATELRDHLKETVEELNDLIKKQRVLEDLSESRKTLVDTE